MAGSRCTWLAGLAVVASHLTGCANVLDYDAVTFDDRAAGFGGGPASGSQCGSVPAGSESCAQCIDAACCVPAAACGANPACGGLVGCRAACAADDVPCLHDCGARYIQGVEDWKAFNGCEDASCAVACGSGG